jgi:hypothetical protein
MNGLKVGDKVRTKRTFHTTCGQIDYLDLPVGTVGQVIDETKDKAGYSLYEVEFKYKGHVVEFLAYVSELEFVG